MQVSNRQERWLCVYRAVQGIVAWIEREVMPWGEFSNWLHCVSSAVDSDLLFASKGSSTGASGGPGMRRRRMSLITLCDVLSPDWDCECNTFAVLRAEPLECVMWEQWLTVRCEKPLLTCKPKQVCYNSIHCGWSKSCMERERDWGCHLISESWCYIRCPKPSNSHPHTGTRL